MIADRSHARASVAVAALELFPPIIREALIVDPKFQKEYGIALSAVVSVGASGISFQRSELFDAVKGALDSATETSVEDTDGGTWRIKAQEDSGEMVVALVQNEKTLLAPQIALLSSDGDTRVKTFRAQARRVNFPTQDVEVWEALLESRPPDADELMRVMGDFADTPTGKQHAIEEALQHGRVSFELLSPRSERYYERLVGKHEGEQSLTEFVAQVATPHMKALVKERPFEGYLLASLVAASQGLGLGLALSTEGMEDAELVRAYDWLAGYGDMLSRAAAIEAGLFRGEETAQIQESLARLIHTVVSPTPNSMVDPFKLFSAVMILVYGEMAYNRTLVSKPPYWRRLAAIAHTAIVVRAIIAVGGDASGFVKWAMEARGQSFMLQCYCDMRLEPRWIPDLALPHQLKQEFVGRVFHAANAKEEVVVAAGWKGLLLDDVDGGLRRQLNMRQAFLAGPLEGGASPIIEIPEESLEELRTDLRQSVITASSFSALANSALLFRISEEICDLAADAIARADYRIENADETTPLIPHLLGLATAAAVTRNQKLADALFIVVRKYRLLYPNDLSVENAFRVAMHASASRVNLSDWCKCVGSALTDLSFQDITEEDAVRLHSHIVHLCELVPELWATCGQAEAALRSVLNT